MADDNYSVWLGVVEQESGRPTVEAVLWSEAEADAWVLGAEAGYTRAWAFQFDYLEGSRAVSLSALIEEATR